MKISIDLFESISSKKIFDERVLFEWVRTPEVAARTRVASLGDGEGAGDEYHKFVDRKTQINIKMSFCIIIRFFDDGRDDRERQKVRK